MKCRFKVGDRCETIRGEWWKGRVTAIHHGHVCIVWVPKYRCELVRHHYDMRHIRDQPVGTWPFDNGRVGP